jgi:cellulose synthase/poly-beta-1,6-N-acetylglucosamine synthase-like glycosyltransferase
MALTSTDITTGDLLVERRMLTLAQLDEALGNAQACNVPLGDVLLAKRWIKPRQYFKTLANSFGLPFLDLMDEAPDASLLKSEDAKELARYQTMPWRKKNERLVIVTANPGPETITYARARWGKNIDFAVTAKFDILWTLQSVFREAQLKHAMDGPFFVDGARARQCSVSHVHVISVLAGIFVLAAAFIFAPIEALTVINAALAVFYAGVLLFNAALAWLGRKHKPRSGLSLGIEARLLKQDELPVYTVLVPIFRNPAALPPIAHTLRQMHYPLAKLDIKIVLEENDTETIDAAKALGLEGVFEIIRVPASEPYTKAKACNYALQFARGEFVVVYSAGDTPEPDQLRKAVTVFRQSPAEMACVQCGYYHYNDEENWIERRFDTGQSPEYAHLSRGLERLGIPVLLNGMSNHFRFDVLQQLRGWNPYCVAADTDLGIRMAEEGYRATSIASRTFKAVGCTVGNCIWRQAFKIKGTLQTLSGYARRPLRLWRKAGTLASLGVFFQVAGSIIAALANPWIWFVLALVLGLTTGGFDHFPVVLTSIILFNFVVGGFFFARISRIPPIRQGKNNRLLNGVITQIYWLLASAAVYRALWELIWRIPDRQNDSAPSQCVGTGEEGSVPALSEGGR